MKLSKSLMTVLALVLVVGTGLVLSGCATCCGESAPAKPAMKCAFGVQGCNKDASAVWIEKSMPDQVVVGQPFQYTLQVTNLRGCALEDVVIVERASDGLQIQSGEEGLNIGFMKPNEVRQIVLTAVASQGGSPSTCTTADYKPVLCCGTEAISPSLAIALEAQATGTPCDVIPAKVTVSNPGTGMARNANISMDLPKGLTTTDGQSSVMINVGDLAGNDAKAYNVNLKSAQSGSYSIKANAEASGLTAASNAVTIDVRNCDLNASVSGPAKVFITKDASYKVSVQNTGDADAASTDVTASIPAGMKYVSASNGGSVSGNSVVWNVGTLGAGKSVSMDMTLNAVSGGSGMSVATAKAYCCQGEGSCPTNIEGIPALLLEAIDVADPIQVGGTEKYYITVTNQGSAPDTNIVLSVGFEEQFDYQSSNGPTAAVKESVKSVEFAPLASLAAGQKATWEVIGKAKSVGDHRTSIKITSDFLKRSVDETESTHVY
ncbi:MAG: Large cysteine-rich periplasmic protein OmcB precursor [Candidatus Omnitrophica bacterium ADurb.Bin277]|nr:MAG: Large cysteine-rich periplasmic protein OmcB precursor [Candidatus Omnitrophica bacterium ADurb.Bin277]